MSIQHTAARKLYTVAPRSPTDIKATLIKATAATLISEMSVRQLKEALDERKVSWADCIERQDLIQKLRDSQPIRAIPPQPQPIAVLKSDEESHTPQACCRTEHISIVIAGSTIKDLAIPTSYTILQLKEMLYDQKHTTLIPRAQKIVSRGKVLEDDQNCLLVGSKKFMVFRDAQYTPTEVHLTLQLPSKLPPLRTFCCPKTTIAQIKEILLKHHSFPPAECYTLFRGSLELQDGMSLQHYCLDDPVVVEVEVVPTMLLKLHAKTRLEGDDGEDEQRVHEDSTGSDTLVPSNLRTGLVGPDAGRKQRSLHVTTEMEMCYPPHAILAPAMSKKRCARHALALVEQDMENNENWTMKLQQGMQMAVFSPMAGGVPVALPAELARRVVTKMKKLASQQKAKRLRSLAHKFGKHSASPKNSFGFSKGFLSDSTVKGDTKEAKAAARNKLREEKAARQAACAAAATASAAAQIATRCASAAKKATKKKKKRRFKSVMADLIAPADRDAAGDVFKQQRQALEKANPKIEFSKLDRI